MSFDTDLAAAVGADRVERNAPLAPWTTFKVGGPADWFVILRNGNEIAAVAAVAARHGVPLTVIGGGSNLLVADDGVRGLVVRIHGGEVRQLGPSTVRADAGVTINGLVRWTVGRGLAGVEAWAGTPGTVGGAIYGNAHFQGRLVSELISSVVLLSPRGEVVTVPAGEMGFAYDYSRLHETAEIVLAADFTVHTGDPDRLRATARDSLAFRKRTQPLENASAGCIFQNPDPTREQVPPDIPASAGALVDRAGLKGAVAGGAHVSDRHANFIVNAGSATAADIAALIETCRDGVQRRFGIALRDEVVRLGFSAPKGPHVDSQS